VAFFIKLNDSRCWRQRGVFVATLFAIALSACSPRVEVAAPEKPIEINLNVKIEHEVRINVQKDLEQEVFSDDSNLF
jgi:hypothetical protein